MEGAVCVVGRVDFLEAWVSACREIYEQLTQMSDHYRDVDRIRLLGCFRV